MKNLIFALLFLFPLVTVAQQMESKKEKFTVSSTMKPLFVLDGKIVSEDVIKGKYTDKKSDKILFPSDQLDPNDIERVDVLKGDSATAKYGEAGKNGVVVITTKAFLKKSKKL